MSESLYTGTPAGTFADGGANGITTATAMTFGVSGNVSAIRFYAGPNIATANGTVELWQVTSLNDAAPAGTRLSSQTFVGSSLTANAWNVVNLPSAVAVDTTHVYRAAVNNSLGQYSLTAGFYTSGSFTTGDITGLQDKAGTYPNLNNGSFAFNSPANTYPSGSGSAAAYAADVIFNPGAPSLMAANLVFTSGLTAKQTTEAHFGATLSVANTMSAAQTTEAHLTTTFGAGVNLAAHLTAVNPAVDPIAQPVVQELLTCFTDQLSSLASPPKYIQVRVGQETGPLFGPNTDECCAGLAWIRVDSVYPSWDSFPAEDNTWTPTAPYGYAVVLEMGVAFCMPWSDSEEGFENLDPPSTADWNTAFTTQMRHQTLMRRAAACCWLPTQRRAVGAWNPLPLEAGCTGGKLTVTVSVIAPCADC